MARLMRVLLAVLAALLLAEPTLAEAAACPSRAGAVPTTGGSRPGPFGLGIPPETTGEGAVAPVGLAIPAAGVDTGVEVLGIVDNMMLNPTGPWLVGWYPELGAPGAPGNTVLSGHINYVDVGPAVFANVAALGPGAEIVVVGADGRLFRYAVDWVASYEVATITDADLATIIGPSDGQILTLITCGGVWDEAAREYLSRTVVRATLVGAASAAVEQGEWRFRPGATAEVVEDGVDLRAEPSTTAEVVAELDEGARLRIEGRQVEADGYAWWPVRDERGRSGFVAGPGLSCVDERAPASSPNQRVATDDGTAGPPGESPRQDGTGGPGPTDDGTAGPDGAAPVASGRRAPPRRRA
jgi:sortase (surface protein transpeptidase)